MAVSEGCWGVDQSSRSSTDGMNNGEGAITAASSRSYPVVQQESTGWELKGDERNGERRCLRDQDVVLTKVRKRGLGATDLWRCVAFFGLSCLALLLHLLILVSSSPPRGRALQRALTGGAVQEGIWFHELKSDVRLYGVSGLRTKDQRGVVEDGQHLQRPSETRSHGSLRKRWGERWRHCRTPA